MQHGDTLFQLYYSFAVQCASWKAQENNDRRRMHETPVFLHDGDITGSTFCEERTY